MVNSPDDFRRVPGEAEATFGCATDAVPGTPEPNPAKHRTQRYANCDEMWKAQRKQETQPYTIRWWLTCGPQTGQVACAR